MAKANPFDINTAHKYEKQRKNAQKMNQPWLVGKRNTSNRQGKTTITPFQSFGRMYGGNPVDRSNEQNRWNWAAQKAGKASPYGGGGGGGYTNEARGERELGYKAIKRGEDRMGQDQTLALVDKYIKQMLPEVAGQMPALNEAQKKVEIDRAESIGDAQFKSNMANLANVAGIGGIGATGLKAKSTLAHGKEQYGSDRAKALRDARAGIIAGTLKNAQQAMASAGNLGLGVASGRAAAAQPFTLQESRERFGQSFPNV